jgi:hypothetical protein
LAMAWVQRTRPTSAEWPSPCRRPLSAVLEPAYSMASREHSACNRNGACIPARSHSL